MTRRDLKIMQVYLTTPAINTKSNTPETSKGRNADTSKDKADTSFHGELELRSKALDRVSKSMKYQTTMLYPFQKHQHPKTAALNVTSIEVSSIWTTRVKKLSAGSHAKVVCKNRMRTARETCRNPHRKWRPIKKSQKGHIVISASVYAHPWTLTLNRLITPQTRKRKNPRKYDIRSDSCLPIISSGSDANSSPYYTGSRRFEREG
ncbi:hypothetical protein JTE90_000313 [Oedothorax gibbosus]|uniref:Uncharacterized protein n=1 Tax=Oedothorax gibbosus TaxID=931172 RepID=A0AAV6VTR3_9ARAC|nr:hypothetical protein JTE90_000313 [Oedothorax gibbosus]